MLLISHRELIIKTLSEISTIFKAQPTLLFSSIKPLQILESLEDLNVKRYLEIQTVPSPCITFITLR
jgi:hypothetical protein